MKSPRALRRRELLLATERRRVFIVDELDVAAKRYPGETPARSVLIVKPIYFRAEADRKGLDGHATPARHEEMSELVNENNERQNEQEHDPVLPDPSCERRQKVHRCVILRC